MSLLWLKVAVLLYGIAALAVLPAALYSQPRWRHVAIPATVTAMLFHFVSLAEMLNAAHHSLPVEAHELQSLLALLLAIAFVAVYAPLPHRRIRSLRPFPSLSCSAFSQHSARARNSFSRFVPGGFFSTSRCFLPPMPPSLSACWRLCFI